MREAGLREARAGAMPAGIRLVTEARQNRDRVRLSVEAGTMFETHQLAAESFIDYRRGHFPAAAARMRESIGYANELRRRYDYPTALRRVHLGANLLRVAVASGSWQEASTWDLSLLFYLLGQRAKWPWLDLAHLEAEPLSGGEILFLLDQIERPTEAALREAGPTYLPMLDKLLTHEGTHDAVVCRTARWAAGMRDIIS